MFFLLLLSKLKLIFKFISQRCNLNLVLNLIIKLVSKLLLLLILNNKTSLFLPII